MSGKPPVWLNKFDILAIHDRLLLDHGGKPGLRDEGLLDSALARPQHLFAYERPNLFDLAAAYASGLTRNHAFNDGNKRVAFMAAFVFLGINGWDLQAPEPEAVQFVLGLTTKRLGEGEFADWLRQNCVPLTKRGKRTMARGIRRTRKRRKP